MFRLLPSLFVSAGLLVGGLPPSDPGQPAPAQVRIVAGVPEFGSVQHDVYKRLRARNPDVAAVTVTYYVDEGLRYYYFYGNGATTSSQYPYDVRVAITTRAWTSCQGCLPEAVDAAASMYRADDLEIGNIQIDRVRLMAGAYPGSLRASTDHAINSSIYGNPISTQTNKVCVSPFGSGMYFGITNVSWRYHLQNTLVQEELSSNYGPSRYATIAC